jgi:hypothetical protein
LNPRQTPVFSPGFGLQAKIRANKRKQMRAKDFSKGYGRKNNSSVSRILQIVSTPDFLFLANGSAQRAFGARARNLSERTPSRATRLEICYLRKNLADVLISGKHLFDSICSTPSARSTGGSQYGGLNRAFDELSPRPRPQLGGCGEDRQSCCKLSNRGEINGPDDNVGYACCARGAKYRPPYYCEALASIEASLIDLRLGI